MVIPPALALPVRNSPAKQAVFEQAILRVFRMGGIGRDYQRGWFGKQSAQRLVCVAARQEMRDAGGRVAS